MSNVLVAGVVHRWAPELTQGVPTRTVCGLDPRQFVEGDWPVTCGGCIFIAGKPKAQGSLWDGAL